MKTTLERGFVRFIEVLSVRITFLMVLSSAKTSDGLTHLLVGVELGVAVLLVLVCFQV